MLDGFQGLTLWGSNSFHATLGTTSCIVAAWLFIQRFGIESVALLWHLFLKKKTCIDLIVIHYISTRDKTFRVTLGTHSWHRCSMTFHPEIRNLIQDASRHVCFKKTACIYTNCTRTWTILKEFIPLMKDHKCFYKTKLFAYQISALTLIVL